MGKLRYVGAGETVSTPQGEYEFPNGEWVEVDDEALYESLAAQPTFETRDGDEDDPCEVTETPAEKMKRDARTTPAEKVTDVPENNVDGKADGAT